MNRRSFIAKVVVGVAAIPLLSKLGNSQPPAKDYSLVVKRYSDPPVWVALGTAKRDGTFSELDGDGYERQTGFARKGAFARNVQVLHEKSVNARTEIETVPA